MMDAPTVGSLFSGIGGLDLGLERAGWRVAFQVENDPYCQRVLAKHWPEVPRWSDIREVNADDLPRVDLLAGGFPCQDLSPAGRRAGIDGARSGLWSEYARLVRYLRPRYVLVENVPGLLRRGMGRVLGDLATCGYDAEWQSISAAAVGAPHIRDRVFIVAYSHGEGQLQPGGALDEEWRWAGDGSQPLADATGNGWEQGRPSTRQGLRQPGCRSDPLADPDFQALEVGRPRRATDDGSPVVDDAGGRRHGPPQGEVFAGGHRPEHASWWDVEPNVGRVAHGVPARVDRLRGLGNAVVPQVAQWIGERLLER